MKREYNRVSKGGTIMKEPKFYKCAHCGNIITKVEDKGVPVFCCGQKMDEMVPNTSDGAGEKHFDSEHIVKVELMGFFC